jgi:lantibiotic modifying enzyme
LISKQVWPGNLEGRLTELGRLAQTNNRIACWPLMIGKNESWLGWCNGSSGYVYLWLLAGYMTRCQYYFDLAIKAGQHIWESNDASNKSSIGHLCCGSAGQSYAFLKLYRHTNNTMWLQRARILGFRFKDLKSSNVSHSLYRGELGIALLMEDVMNPNRSCMPMFETEKVASTI